MPTNQPAYRFWVAAAIMSGGGASPAFAEICDQIRPAWTPGTPVSGVTEALALFSTVPSLVLVISTLLVLRLRSQWGGLAVVIGWTAWVSGVIFLGDGTLRTQAVAEGCMGSPTLFIGAVIAICAGTILYTLPRETRL